ncbi:MAG: phosphoenolpyruvate--protein phosphotransferase [Verrucomicrobia bacterium]|nr:phosphoenolpyruvate--protein phosphotransferase [Verrucomicrobiota bacterium]
MPRERKEIIYQGTPVSRGIASGPLHIVARGFAAPEIYTIPPSHVSREQERFLAALERTKEQLRSLRTQIEEISGEEEGRIFEAHLMVLEDRTILNRVFEAINDRHQNAEYSFYAVIQTFLEAMRRIPDPYLRERTVDIEDVCKRVLRNFSAEPEASMPDQPEHQHILVAYDLNPSDTAAMDRNHVLGFATEVGSINSHTAILARSLGIPAIVGLQNAIFNLHALTPAILDGYTGKLIINPSDETRARYAVLQKEKRRLQKALQKLRDTKTVTTDGRHITLSANIEFEQELPLVAASGAEGIGLFRTEFFLLEREECPSEDEQTELYTRLAQSVRPHPIIIRTLDAGGDKVPGEPLTEPEPNPFLGWRGIRFSLARRDLFKEQLRAILRAGAEGAVSIMFPLISGLREIREAKALLAECIEELTARGVPFNPKIDIGAMIEVPSAAIMAEQIAAEVDFLSIGTNDLIQYTLAVDRINPRVSDLYKPGHPAVVRLIKSTVAGADKAGIWTGVCGELAGDLLYLPLLVGLGIDELSVGTQQVPIVKQAVRHLSYKDCQALAHSCLRVSETREVIALCQSLAEEAYPDLLRQMQSDQ